MLPPEQMRRLYDVLQAAGSKRVVWTEFAQGTHMEAYEICRAEYWQVPCCLSVQMGTESGMLDLSSSVRLTLQFPGERLRGAV